VPACDRGHRPLRAHRDESRGARLGRSGPRAWSREWSISWA